MKYISIEDLKKWGKELRFQSEQQMAEVYDRMPQTEIIHCKDCKYRIICADDDDWFCADGERKEE